MNEQHARVRRVVCDVVADALRATAAPGVLVLADWTPEGILLHEWLSDSFGDAVVWKESDARDGVSDALTAHPANRTALMLGGRPPHADLLPLGDLLASQVAELTGQWSAPDTVEQLCALAGGVLPVDAALQRMLDGRQTPQLAMHELPAEAAAAFINAWERGRWFRLHTRLVPKLSGRTLGIDLFD